MTTTFLVQAKPMVSIEEMRALFRRHYEGDKIRPVVLQAIKETIDAMCFEAEEYGFEKTDVLRAITRNLKMPMSRDYCNCSVCVVRRKEKGS